MTQIHRMYQPQVKNYLVLPDLVFKNDQSTRPRVPIPRDATWIAHTHSYTSVSRLVGIPCDNLGCFGTRTKISQYCHRGRAPKLNAVRINLGYFGTNPQRQCRNYCLRGRAPERNAILRDLRHLWMLHNEPAPSLDCPLRYHQ